MKHTKVIYGIFVMMFVVTSAFVMMDEWKVPEKYVTMKNPQAGVEDEDEIGADLWFEHCASCHGKTGVGDGKKAGELETEIRDFTEEEFQKQSDGTLYYKSFTGKGEMPNFEKKITDKEERWFLINYLRALAE